MTAYCFYNLLMHVEVVFLYSIKFKGHIYIRLFKVVLILHTTLHFFTELRSKTNHMVLKRGLPTCNYLLTCFFSLNLQETET